MRIVKYLCTLLLCMAGYDAWCQADTTRKTRDLQGIEVKAHRVETESLSARSVMPVTVINRKTLDMMGSRRLDEVLREQTGLAIINDISSGSRAVGLQMQGFSAAYTMILIDGQPLIGRNSGNFDLSRITVSDIERIEIVKGASSSLFGSEALAGVVNIITRQTVKAAQGMAALRYGSLHIVDATVEGETPFAKQKGTAYLSGNFYRTDGYSVNPYLTQGTTAPPYHSYSLQGRGRYTLSNTSSLSFSGRYAMRRSSTDNTYGGKDAENTNRDVLQEDDANASIILNNNFKQGTRLKTQYYFTRYASDQHITAADKGIRLEQSAFTQYLHRAEVQVSRDINTQLSLIGGAGGALEMMHNNAYKGVNNMKAAFAYAQGDWKWKETFNAMAGVRYDQHDLYGGRLNPSAGLRYSPVKLITLKASVGTGFKAPDFKERYQVFTNPQRGYTVLGAAVLGESLKAMQDAGQISEIRPVADRIGKELQPETSVSYNAGIAIQPVDQLKLDVSVFYHDVHNLINTIQVATKTNYQQVFSYKNIARAAMSGMEAGMIWKPVKGLDISMGYQLLYAKDRGIIDSIKTGVYRYSKIRDSETGITRASRVSDYFGLENRSRHMANLRVFYTYDPWGVSASFRANYRGKFGYDDNNNNGFLDQYDTYVDSHCLLYVSLEKKLFKKQLSVQLTVDNVMDYTDMLMPGQPGRIIMGGLTWRFTKDVRQL